MRFCTGCVIARPRAVHNADAGAMRHAIPLPAELDSAFTRAQGLAASLSPKQLRRADLLIPFRGIRMVSSAAHDQDGQEDPFRDGAADAVRALASAYALALPPGVHLSHSTAAVLHGIPLPRHAFAQTTDAALPLADRVLIEASMPRPGRAPRGARVRGHQTRPPREPTTLCEGIPVATPAAAWAGLAARVGVEDLVAIGDAIVRIPRIPGPLGRELRAPLGTFAELDAVIAAGRRPGIRRLREARTLIRIGTASPKETQLRLALTTATGLPAPDLDVDVYSGDGVFLGCSELAYPQFRVAVEYEGDYHRKDRRRWYRDIDKYQSYAAAGWRVLQVTAPHLRRPQEVVARVAQALQQAGWRPHS